MQRGGNAGVMQTDASPPLISPRRLWIMNEAPYTSLMLKVSSVHTHNLLIVLNHTQTPQSSPLAVPTRTQTRSLWGAARVFVSCLATVKHKADTISCLAVLLKPHYPVFLKCICARPPQNSVHACVISKRHAAPRPITSSPHLFFL